MNERGLIPEERATLIELLGRVDPGQPLGTELYNAVAKITISVAIEAITLRQGDKGLEVFLTKRSPTDSAYPDMWHSPGTVLRSKEQYADCFARLETREFKNKLKSWSFIGENNCHDEARGHFVQHLYLCELEDDASDNWFPVDNLPRPIVPNHEEVLIPRAVEAFRELNAQ